MRFTYIYFIPFCPMNIQFFYFSSSYVNHTFVYLCDIFYSRFCSMPFLIISFILNFKMRDPDGGIPNLVEEAPVNFQQYFSHLKWEQMVAGIAGGSITTAILHPLELAKIRLQVNEGNGAVKTRYAF